MDEIFTEAARRGAGLTEDCYELSVMAMFRREYVGALEDGESILAEYAATAPQIVQAINELSGEDSQQKVWECIYVAGLVPAVLLITRGQWDEAYHLYRSLCGELEAIFLEDHLEGYSWLESWVEAKLAEAPAEALDAASRSGVLPLEKLHTGSTATPTV